MSRLLLESGDELLIETGDFLLLEIVDADPNAATLTLRDRGHQVTVEETGQHTIRDRGHTWTGRENR